MAVSNRIRIVDWPFLVVAAALAAVFLLRARVGRPEGALMVGLGFAPRHHAVARPYRPHRTLDLLEYPGQVVFDHAVQESRATRTAAALLQPQQPNGTSETLPADLPLFGTPRWVKVVGIVVLILLLGILIATGIGSHRGQATRALTRVDRPSFISSRDADWPVSVSTGNCPRILFPFSVRCA